jgi:hypothetical protein
MGCWWETCVVSQTPIYAGDAVVMAVINKCYVTQGREYNHIGHDGRLHRAFELFAAGEYNDYGWLEGLEGSNSEGMTERPEPYQRALFVHKTVWAAVQAAAGDEGRRKARDFVRRALAEDTLTALGKKRPRAYVESLVAWTVVLNYCYHVRIDPLGALAYKGCQHGELDDYQAHHKLVARALKDWKARERGRR